MKGLRAALITILVVAVLGRPTLPAAENPVGNGVEDDVWALEHEYMSAFKNADHEKVLAFYHQDFLGWPASQERPSGIVEAEKFLEEHYAQPIPGSLEIERAGIRVFGDVVITHYLINVTTKSADGGEQTHATRITHTWRKEAGRWWILGGMSSAYRNERPE